jgi:protein SCO1/2
MAARPLLIGVVAIVAFAVGLFLARTLLHSTAGGEPPTRATLFPEPRPLPAVALTDQDGRALDAGFFAGHWTLVFFGFTQCPDVCPTTLATLARTKAALEDLPPAERPRVLLVSVDPERDRPAILARYVRFFDPSFLAATGEPAAIATVAAGFGVPYAKVALSADAYTVDHGSGVFVVGPGGITAYSSAPHDATVLAHDYRLIIARHRTGR